MTQTTPAPPAAPPHGAVPRKPPTDAAAVRATTRALTEMRERAEQIIQAPTEHHPRLVTSEHVRGTSLLDKIADAVNVICGSMYVFLGVTIGIVIWLFAGNIIGFDKTPWPLLLTILNLPQLSIMISLQVSANRSQSASDKRAIADHETLLALHEMGKQQLDILHGQDKVLANQDSVLSMLQGFAAKDMPGRQQAMQASIEQILAQLSGHPAAGGPPAPPPGPAAPAAG